MSIYYSDEKHVQVLVSLLKQHKIRKVIASPGTTNSAFVTSLKHDGAFEIFSSVDERSAAYLACGLAAESGEPVVITCTGATASRNYMPGLTEAYYRKLPIIAVTGAQAYSKIGHHIAQVIDRSVMPKDVVRLSVSLPAVKDENDIWDCEMKVNTALLETLQKDCGPVHINLPTVYGRSFTTKELPVYRFIEKIEVGSTVIPQIPKHIRIGVFIGSHKKWTTLEVSLLEKFCEVNNAVVFCDHTSGYNGKYKVNFALVSGQVYYDRKRFRPDLLIHLGEISGDYQTLGLAPKEVWRVNVDGKIRDTFGRLRYVFQMGNAEFFSHYCTGDTKDVTYYNNCKQAYDGLANDLPKELPFSNIWMASQLHAKIPKNSSLHFGILNSLRSWNFFEVDNSIDTNSNVGGFGIDGGLSSLIGASLADRNKLFFCVIGDLAFFYDINVLGNRHVGNNVRILLVNNGKGVEFRQFNHYALQFGESADEFIAASGHFGDKSPDLVKNFAKGLGYEYFSASTKEEFSQVYERFVDPELSESPMIFEVFTEAEEDSKALELISTIQQQPLDASIKGKVASVLGKGTVSRIKTILKK